MILPRPPRILFLLPPVSRNEAMAARGGGK